MDRHTTVRNQHLVWGLRFRVEQIFPSEINTWFRVYELEFSTVLHHTISHQTMPRFSVGTSTANPVRTRDYPHFCLKSTPVAGARLKTFASERRGDN